MIQGTRRARGEAFTEALPVVPPDREARDPYLRRRLLRMRRDRGRAEQLPQPRND